MKIETDDLSRPAVHALIEEHLHSMRALSPPESVFALDLEKLRRPEITFWSAWDGSSLLGCGALKALGERHGEIKSMRTTTAARRRGVARAILTHIVEVAKSSGYERLSLETGSADAFRPAHTLYRSAGFVDCGPFSGYAPDANSVFMTLLLRAGAATGPWPMDILRAWHCGVCSAYDRNVHASCVTQRKPRCRSNVSKSRSS